MKSLVNRRLEAFTLLEMAMVLLVIGLIASAAFKGRYLLEAAKMRSVINEFHRCKLAIEFYHEQYGVLPGDDVQASERFGQEISNGNGDGFISESDSEKVWQHLFQAGFIETSLPPESRLGGKFYLTYYNSPAFKGHCLRLGKGDLGNLALLTPQQAQKLKMKMNDHSNNKEGSLRFIEGEDASVGECIRDNTFNLSSRKASCVALFLID